ncbi:MAG TPA: ClpX C4-type zinc finger protein [Candidatus Limnocylindrales bacterium]
MTQSEFKDLRVQLDVWGKTSAGLTISKDTALRQAAINASPQATRIIAEALGVEGASGWQPDGATDLPSLLLAGRVVWRQTGGIMFSWKFTFDSVTLRFGRSVLPAPSAQTSARFCDQCGSPVGVEARFCAACGAATTAASVGEAKAPGSVQCSFCGKSQSEVRVLVSGRGAFICDECLKLNHELTAQ